MLKQLASVLEAAFMLVDCALTIVGFSELRQPEAVRVGSLWATDRGALVD